MTSRIAEVSSEADQTGRHVKDVHDDIAGLATAMDDLRHSVICVVRTSTTEVDRRQSRRYEVDLPCRLEFAGDGIHTARVRDLSDGGGRIEGGPAMRTGDRGALRLDGLGTALPFTVCVADDGMSHMAFTLDEATAAPLRVMLDRPRQRAAA
jgi:methyl-accepting chemotaxis protein